jgi:hypothetical protein
LIPKTNTEITGLENWVMCEKVRKKKTFSVKEAVTNLEDCVCVEGVISDRRYECVLSRDPSNYEQREQR